MRFARCLVRLSILPKDENGGTAYLPKGMFDGFDEEDKLLIVTQRKDTKYITIHPIDHKDSIIYELYCELCIDKALPKFIMNLKRVTMGLNITLLTITEGICKGDSKSPCTYDGFVAVKPDTEDKIPILREKIKSIEINGKRIVQMVKTYKV